MKVEKGLTGVEESGLWDVLREIGPGRWGGGVSKKKIKIGENFKTKPLNLYVNESKLIQIREK